jgi:hypothetical protein
MFRWLHQGGHHGIDVMSLQSFCGHDHISGRDEQLCTCITLLIMFIIPFILLKVSVLFCLVCNILYPVWTSQLKLLDVELLTKQTCNRLEMKRYIFVTCSVKVFHIRVRLSLSSIISILYRYMAYYTPKGITDVKAAQCL